MLSLDEAVRQLMTPPVKSLSFLRHAAGVPGQGAGRRLNRPGRVGRATTAWKLSLRADPRVNRRDVLRLIFVGVGHLER